MNRRLVMLFHYRLCPRDPSPSTHKGTKNKADQVLFSLTYQNKGKK